MEDLLRHLVFLAKEFAGFSKRCIIKIILLELGISTEQDGFEYLVDSILIYSDRGCCSTTKIIYPEVARIHNAEKCAVGKAIERGIHSGWSKRNRKWNMYFLYEECPTSAAFISRIAKIIEIWNACCESVPQKEEVR